MTAISNKKNEIKKMSFKHHDYANVFDEIDIKKLFKHRSHDHAIEIKTKFIFFIFFIIYLLRNLNVFENI